MVAFLGMRLKRTGVGSTEVHKGSIEVFVLVLKRGLSPHQVPWMPRFAISRVVIRRSLHIVFTANISSAVLDVVKLRARKPVRLVFG